MSYQLHAGSIHDAQRREAPQQLPRSAYSYEQHHPAMTGDDADRAEYAWNPHHSHPPPKLPPPRNTSNHPARHPYREPTPAWTAEGGATGAFELDAHFDEAVRRRSFHPDAEHYVAESSSRTRLPHFADKLASHYPPPTPAAYARSANASAARMHHDALERDQAKYGYTQSPSPDAGRSRVESSSTDSRTLGFAPSLPPHADPRHDPFPRHSRHHEEVSRARQSSLRSLEADSPEASRFHPVTLTPAWPTSRSHQATRRPLPSDVDVRSAAPPARPFATSNSELVHGSPKTSQTQGHILEPAPLPGDGTEERGLQQPDSGAQSAAPRIRPALDSAEPSRAYPIVAPSSAALVRPSPDTAETPRHPLQPQRKRLRISRACDECRRRKTRCDIVGAFPGEPGHPLTVSGAVPPLEPNVEPKGEMLILQPCMNCRRSQVTCSYSKRPLKRGPSKGYIKDLERRLNSLESQIVSCERAEAGDSMQHGQTQDGAAPAGSVRSSSAFQPAKPKIRTEDRISRLESVLARPSSAKSEEANSVSSDVSRRNSDANLFYIKSEANEEVVSDRKGLDSAVDISTTQRPDSTPTPPTTISPETPVTQTASADISSKSTASAELVDVPAAQQREPKLPSSKRKGKSKRRSAASSPARTPDTDVAEVKAKVVSSFLHATFPILPVRREGEGSRSDSSSANIAHLEDRVLVRGMKLLIEPVDMVTAQQNSPGGTPSLPNKKAQPHAARVASLVGQASAGLGGSHDELAQRARSSADGLRALRKVSHRLSGQEADLLMLCHLDYLRNGRSNNSALAAAVSKLGSGWHVQNDRETYRRRTLLFMLDRWHAIAFGTPHLLMGRFGMERNSFRSMKEALGDASGSPLGDAVYEVLRCAIMLGQLNDLVHNNGGWKGVSKSDVDAVIHSATDDNERASAAASNGNDNDALPSGSGNGDTEPSPNLISTQALRYSLENLVRCYYALHTLPNAKDARIEDLQRIFNLAESVIVLGTAKTPISLQGKLLQSAIGPHVLAVIGVAFSWCLRIICTMVAISLSSSNPLAAPTSSGKTTATVTVSPTSYPLEFYRRKIFDYVRMCGPYCLFSGGAPTAPASFAPLYLRLALYFNSTVSLASRLGSLVSPQSNKASPIHQDATALANDADSVLDMANELGCLGYVLALTHQTDAASLLTRSAHSPS